MYMFQYVQLQNVLYMYISLVTHQTTLYMYIVFTPKENIFMLPLKANSEKENVRTNRVKT